MLNLVIMRTINTNILLFSFFIVFVSCIEEYKIDNIQSSPLFVVDGSITDEAEEQVLNLTYSSSISEPNYLPVKNAEVMVVDKAGNIFNFKETIDRGVYLGKVGQEYLIPGNAFKLFISTKDGKDYESSFEEITKCNAVDSVYYEINQNSLKSGNGASRSGITFFVDLENNSNYSSFYKWNLEETYEYRSTWPIERYWWGRMRRKNSPDYSRYYCFKVEQIPSVFTESVKSINENAKLKSQLHTVTTETQRLYYRYSLLVKQKSLTQKAYLYWERLKENNQQSGGLYDKQPGNVIGNMVCTSNPDEKVLGYFGVSSVNLKRIFVYNDELKNNINFYGDVFCEANPVGNMDWINRTTKDDWPIYFAPSPSGDTALYYGPKACFDCTLRGGTTKLPTFWDE